MVLYRLCNIGRVHSMNNTFTIQEHDRYEAEYRIRKFSVLADSLYALEVASTAIENEWALSIVNEQKKNLAEHLFHMVDGNGYAEGQDELTAKWYRGILSDSEYYGFLGIFLRGLLRRP